MLLDISWRPSQQGFETTLHDKMPDVVLYREDKKPAGKRQNVKCQNVNSMESSFISP